jgi:hypothetical protein
VSHWGRDSIWGQSGPLDPPAPGAFPRAARSDSGLQLEETTDATVTAVSHEVGHDPEYRPELLYCDVAVEPTPEPYHPFVRLALARCQPSSLPGLELSRVVLADFVQVPPKRTVTVSPDPGPELLLVDVQGFSAVRSPFLALVRVSVESRTPGVDDPDLGWTPVPDDSPGVVVEKTVVNQTPILWRGHVSLPSDRTAGQFRIVVREVEPLVTDDSQGSPDPEGRLVFAETLVV